MSSILGLEELQTTEEMGMGIRRDLCYFDRFEYMQLYTYIQRQ